MKHLRLLYSPNVGQSLPDGEIEKWWTDLIRDEREFCQIGQDLMLLRARVGLVEGDIDELTVSVQGVDYRVNDDGTLNDWSMFPEVNMNLLTRLIDRMMS